MKKKYMSSIGIIGALVVNAFSDNHGDLSKQIEGEWIMYRGDQYDIRKISNGIGVEKIVPYHSPKIESLKVLKKGKVRRAKLYYLRGLSGKAARIKERPSK